MLITHIDTPSIFMGLTQDIPRQRPGVTELLGQLKVDFTAINILARNNNNGREPLRFELLLPDDFSRNACVMHPSRACKGSWFVVGTRAFFCKQGDPERNTVEDMALMAEALTQLRGQSHAHAWFKEAALADKGAAGQFISHLTEAFRLLGRERGLVILGKETAWPEGSPFFAPRLLEQTRGLFGRHPPLNLLLNILTEMQGATCALLQEGHRAGHVYHARALLDAAGKDPGAIVACIRKNRLCIGDGKHTAYWRQLISLPPDLIRLEMMALMPFLHFHAGHGHLLANNSLSALWPLAGLTGSQQPSPREAPGKWRPAVHENVAGPAPAPVSPARPPKPGRHLAIIGGAQHVPRE